MRSPPPSRPDSRWARRCCHDHRATARAPRASLLAARRSSPRAAARRPAPTAAAPLRRRAPRSWCSATPRSRTPASRSSRSRTTTRSDRIVAPGLMALDETRTARVGSLQEGLILETLAQVGDRVRAAAAAGHDARPRDARRVGRLPQGDRRRAPAGQRSWRTPSTRTNARRRLYADKAISLQEVQRAEVDRVSATQMVDMAKAEVTPLDRGTRARRRLRCRRPSRGQARRIQPTRRPSRSRSAARSAASCSSAWSRRARPSRLARRSSS